MSLNLYLDKEILAKKLRVIAFENERCNQNQPLKAMGLWEGGLSNQRNRNVCQKQCQIIFSPPHTSTPLRMDGAWVPSLPTMPFFLTHRNYLSPGDVGCDVAHEERASLMQGPGFTFQPRSILGLLPFFFLGLLLVLECCFYTRSSGSR